jgi:hypothetical protein
MIDTIIICTIFGVFLILAFIIGARVGQKIVKGEEVKVELPNPIKAIQEHNEKREAEKEIEKIDIMVENIDNYDGTGLGQKQLPN